VSRRLPAPALSARFLLRCCCFHAAFTVDLRQGRPRQGQHKVCTQEVDALTGGAATATTAEAPESLMLQLSEEFQRELAARAQAQRQLHAGEESHGEPASPSLHQRGASVGPGQLFVHRAALQGGSPTSASGHSNGGGGLVEPTSTRPSELPCAVELAPLLRRFPQAASPEPAAVAGTQPRGRVLPPLWKLAPLATAVFTGHPRAREHRQLSEGAIDLQASSISASATPPAQS